LGENTTIMEPENSPASHPPVVSRLPMARLPEAPAKRRRLRRRTLPQLLTRDHVDGRTSGGKRARVIAAELCSSFGDEITAVQRQAIERVAMLCAIAEDLAARRLAGQPVPIDEVLRAEGAARRALRAVLAERPAKPAAARVLELRRQRWEEAAEAKAAQAAQREASSEQNPTEPLDGREADK
jgi:hypothetical protein